MTRTTDLEAAEQACELFMDERNALRAERSAAIETAFNIAGELSYVKRANEILGQDMELAKNVLDHIADFANSLQERLNSIGIKYQANAETGQPDIFVDPDKVIAALVSATHDPAAS